MNKMRNGLTLARGIVGKLRRRGFAAYFVGGCVRDMARGKVPKDIDIATSASVKQIKNVFPVRSIGVGAQFGTVLLVKNKIAFQVSTFRGKKDSGGKSNLEEDVRLRDFTINGLAYDPFKDEIIDLVQGINDIRQKRIRAIGCAASRMREDPLRLIRAIRFAVTLGFTIEEETFEATQKMASRIKMVSPERIRDELILIFTSLKPAQGLTLLDESGLLKHILPQVSKLKGVEQPQAFHPEGDVFSHTLLMLQKLSNPSLLLALACLFHDLGKPLTFQVLDRIRFSGHDRVGAKLADRILRKFCFSNKDREAIVACVENHMRIMEAPKMRQATLKRLLARPTFEEELKLHYLDCIASHRDLRIFRFLGKRYIQFKKSPIIPRPLLNGHELKKMGFTPGPIFGKIHKQMVDQQLEAKLQTKSAAKKWVISRFKKTNIHI